MTEALGMSEALLPRLEDLHASWSHHTNTENGNLDTDKILKALLRLLHCVEIDDRQGPLQSQLAAHKDMPGILQQLKTDVTEAVSTLEGRTLLYVPADDVSDASAVMKDKALLRRLETMLLHWVSQVKDLLHQRSPGALAPDLGPLAEMDFWRRRNEDLQGLCRQIGSPGLQKIIALLEQSGSCNLATFMGLSASLEAEAVQSVKNLQALAILMDPCMKLSSSKPQDIPKTLPIILGRCQVLWNLTNFYGNVDQFAMLSRGISNDIISACGRLSDVSDAILTTQRTVAEHLKESITAMERWRVSYERAFIPAKSNKAMKPQQLNKGAIFAHIENFLRRCRDLLNVCAAMEQFGNIGKSSHLSSNVANSKAGALISMRDVFMEASRGICDKSITILDIHEARWMLAYTTFQKKTHDLEVQFINAIQSMLDCCGSLHQKAHNVQVSLELAWTQASRASIARHHSDLVTAFEREISHAKVALESIWKGQVPKGYSTSSKIARRAYLANAIKSRLCYLWPLIADCASGQPPQHDQSSHVNAQLTMMQSADSIFVTALHTKWFNNIPQDLATRLRRPLLFQDKAAGGLLVVNLDQLIRDTISESLLWEQMRLPVPESMMELTPIKHSLWRLEVKASAVARCYNKALRSLRREDRKLFHDRIRQLDRKVLAATTKLSWASPKGTIDAYCIEALKQCKETYSLIASWRERQHDIDTLCKGIQDNVLFDLSTQPSPLDVPLFADIQADHLHKATSDIQAHHASISAIITELQMIFRSDAADATKEWLQYVAKVNGKVEEALRTFLRRSFSRLGKAINTEKKGPQIFTLRSVLILAKNTRVEFHPGVQEIFIALRAMLEKSVSILDDIRPLGDARKEISFQTLEDGEDAASEDASFAHGITNDKEGLPKMLGILDGTASVILDKVQALLLTWEKKYHMLWDQDKDAFMRRYERAQRYPEEFKADIQKYKNLKDEVLAEGTGESIGFITIEYNCIKQTLVEHCNMWTSRLTDLLIKTTSRVLEEFMSIIQCPDDVKKVAGVEEIPSVKGRYVSLLAFQNALSHLEIGVLETRFKECHMLHEEWDTIRNTTVI